MTIQELNKELGNIDIYLLDQVLKGRYSAGSKILDAGCGEGRNLIYFLNNGYEVYGVDQNPDALRMLHFILGSKYPYCSKSHFVEGAVDDLKFDSDHFDLVISSAVLHFAKNHSHFDQMFTEMIRVLKVGGQLFMRMASNIGLPELEIDPVTGQANLPDGSVRYLLTQSKIEQMVKEFDLSFVEPIKTTNVNNMRCMTTLVVTKD